MIHGHQFSAEEHHDSCEDQQRSESGSVAPLLSQSLNDRDLTETRDGEHKQRQDRRCDEKALILPMRQHAETQKNDDESRGGPAMLDPIDAQLWAFPAHRAA